LAHVWVLALAIPLDKLAEDVESQVYLDAIEKAELEVDELAGKLTEQLNIKLPPPNDSA
jgi:hypothetical protein